MFSELTTNNTRSKMDRIGLLPKIIFLSVLLKFAIAEEFICGDMDIRNSLEEFKLLEDCTTIDGFLQITLIHNATPKDFESIMFPKLTEVTGFVLFYSVLGLKSLGKLFPNLSVIRGLELEHNFALLVYRMEDLEEIGLISLTSIVRGSVAITRNDQLCYVDSIDWDLIAKNGKGDHYIKNNKAGGKCPDVCSRTCPFRKNATKTDDRLCWDRKNCQKVCHRSCGDKLCMKYASCCSEECLGGCRKPNSPAHCFHCANVIHDDECLKSCPPNTLELAEFYRRWCVTAEGCKNMDDSSWNEDHNLRWKLVNGECRGQCPPGYTRHEEDENACRKCNETCKRDCRGILVDSLSKIQTLKGCTRIVGALIIRLDDSKSVLVELESVLSTIEVVDDFVEIARSKHLTSLNFLKNLQKIRGRNKQDKYYSLLVYDNDNLEEIMDFKNRTENLTIESGKIFFHKNPKLCLAKIIELKQFTMLPDWNEKDVSSTSNGYKSTCEVKSKIISSAVTKIESKSAVIRWEIHQLRELNDSQTVLRFMIFYKESKFSNATDVDFKTCNSEIPSWKFIEVSATKSENVSYECRIGELEPFTQYAVFIRTIWTYVVVVRTRDKRAQSEIIYFRTLPDIPSMPLALKVISKEQAKLEIAWKAPSKPNGNVTNYEISGSLIEISRTKIDRRDYCKRPIVLEKLDSKPSRTNEEKSASKSCPQHLQTINSKNVVTEEWLENAIATHAETTNLEIQTDNSTGNGRKIAFKRVSITNKTVIENLTHFSEYLIEVRACHEPDVEGKRLCGNKSFLTSRTLPRGDADSINPSTIRFVITNETRINVTWDEPRNPNGVIVTYEVEYRNLYTEKSTPKLECVTYTRFHRIGYYSMTGLTPSKYKLRVRANSVAGFGKWTDYIDFVIADNHGWWHSDGYEAIAFTLVTIIIIVSLSPLFYVINAIGIFTSVTNEYVVTIPAEEYVQDHWETPRHKITIRNELGQGSFGMVYSGIARNIIDGQEETKCAIKTVNERATGKERIEFLKEASLMKGFNSYHVIKLLGIVSKGQPTLVLMELMANGDLKTYLRSFHPEFSAQKPKDTLSLKCVLRMASEIADGMAYLSAKKFVHRDLAARNCMVGDDFVIKIGDFGMTRNMYETDYYRIGAAKKLLPVRWMAPESLKDGVFTSYSDVWSFGVVLWEMATLASQPYLGFSNEQVLKYVADGEIMEKPENCPDKFYDLMRSCWQQNPKRRPSFMELVKDLLPHVRLNFHKVSFYFSQEAERLASQINTVSRLSQSSQEAESAL